MTTTTKTAPLLLSPTATKMVPPLLSSLALVGGASLTVNGAGSSEPNQLMPAGAARKKIKSVSRRWTMTMATKNAAVLLSSMTAAR
ncbi:MAG: hypothetical protein MPK06_07575 [Alphaproteobacteria bacterium]|nr:hypothetical protein [Alphaproteobacteria bacterium]MDA8004511.1 hypothetical protein [Alphaproteobacteria bacterium]MDA8006373.1 hypothetical protein [Alphaproteobacteria bacterium]MDA8013749.1 hypothetical protein [Alphaproteobacteria bacterium]